MTSKGGQTDASVSITFSKTELSAATEQRTGRTSRVYSIVLLQVGPASRCSRMWLTGVAELVSLEVVGSVRRVPTGLAGEQCHGHASMRQGQNRSES